MLNARAAYDLGATIAPRTRCIEAARHGDVWRVMLLDEANATTYTIEAKTLINAAGPWVGDVSQLVMRDNHRAPVRLVQGSHIVVPRLYDHPGCYIFQNEDQRIFFVIPYEQDFTLIGTTDRDYSGDVAQVHATREEIAYLCKSASEYLRRPVTPEMVVWTYSGVRPLFDESGDGAAQAATRDYVLKVDAPDQSPALLSVFGGKITTYRRLAEAALEKLTPYLPKANGRAAGWTGKVSLPGGDFPTSGFDALLASCRAQYPFLAAPHLRRLLRAYGTDIHQLLKGASSMADLGTLYGADFTQAELAYLVRFEWVREASDAVWRRSKLGLRLDPGQIARIDAAASRMIDSNTAPARPLGTMLS